MFHKHLIALASALLCVTAAAQTGPAPQVFHLVAPHSRGALVIDTSGGWHVDRVVVYDNGQRPVVQMSNDSLHLIGSWMLDDEPQYNDTTAMCRNDMLGGVMKGIAKVSEITNKQNGEIVLPDGQTMLTGSFFVRKQEGHEAHQQVLWAFVAAHHLCAAVHLSRTPSAPGDNSAFGPVLSAFHFDPEYQPTPQDFATLAHLLPPQMAALYGAPAQTPLTADGASQTLTPRPQSLEFALPNHPGLLAMDAPNYAITEMSAKPNRHEFGLRAEDEALHTEVLGFLFVTEPPQPSAAACRDWMLREEKKDVSGRKILKKYEMINNSGVPLAVADYETPKAPENFRFTRRAFVAQGDLCADISLSAENALTLAPSMVILETLRFEPDRAPDFFSVLHYAQVVFDHHDPAHAAPLFEKAVPLAQATPDVQKWRRVATDQASMSYGMAGDLQHSRAINEAAIQRDPDYPLYYYNLACADAEEGNATAARQHLQQAFDRRANTLKGETVPDPTRDDSFLKLKSNKEFWAFLNSLPKQ